MSCSASSPSPAAIAAAIPRCSATSAGCHVGLHGAAGQQPPADLDDPLARPPCGAGRRCGGARDLEVERAAGVVGLDRRVRSPPPRSSPGSAEVLARCGGRRPGGRCPARSGTGPRGGAMTDSSPRSATRKPWLARDVTRPSPTRRRRASRTGVREIPRRLRELDLAQTRARLDLAGDDLARIWSYASVTTEADLERGQAAGRFHGPVADPTLTSGAVECIHSSMPAVRSVLSADRRRSPLGDPRRRHRRRRPDRVGDAHRRRRCAATCRRSGRRRSSPCTSRTAAASRSTPRARPPQPSYFMKPPSTLNAHRGEIRRPAGTTLPQLRGRARRRRRPRA